MIDFGSPAYFALALVVALMGFAIYRLAHWRRAARERFAGPQARRWPSSASWPRTLLLLAAAAVLVFAAARPRWGQVQQVRNVQGIDLVIALDISQSMTAPDVSPSRLKVAQDNLVTLVQAQRGSRIGLVFFAGTPILRSPLTTDSQAMEQLIQRADNEAGLTRVGSDLGAALQQAGVILEGDTNAGRAVILVSDGEDFQNTYAAQATALKQQGIAVFTAGAGTSEGAGLTDVNSQTGEQTPKVDASGAPVVSRLNEDTLRAIADAGGGSYVRLTDGTSLLGLRNDLNRLDQAPLGSEAQRLPVERFQIFVAAAIVLLLLSWFLPRRFSIPGLARARRVRPHPGLALVLLALIVGACGGGNSLHQRNQAANDLYNGGDYQGALTAYQDLLAERPDVDQLSYNAGNTLHRLGDFDRAVTETQRALPPLDPVLGAETYYALGNHLLALDRLEEAYLAYRSSLLLKPDDQDAKHNLELTLLMIGQREGQQPGSPPGAGQNGDQGQGPPAAGQTPAATGEPGSDATPPPGEGSAEPQPGGTPGAAGTPGGEGSPNQDPAAVQRALTDALAGIDQNLTYEDAVKILDLLRQQQQQQLPSGDNGSGPDY